MRAQRGVNSFRKALLKRGGKGIRFELAVYEFVLRTIHCFSLSGERPNKRASFRRAR